MNRTQTVKLRAMVWYGDIEIDINFPESWDVHVCAMKGQNAPVLTDAGIREAFARPIGTKKHKGACLR